MNGWCLGGLIVFGILRVGGLKILFMLELLNLLVEFRFFVVVLLVMLIIFGMLLMLGLGCLEDDLFSLSGVMVGFLNNLFIC